MLARLQWEHHRQVKWPRRRGEGMDGLNIITGGIGNVRKILFPEAAIVVFEQQDIQKQAESILDAYYSGDIFGIIAGNGSWRANIRSP